MVKEVISLRVEGMSCMHCVKSIQKAVGDLNGVDRVEVDLQAGKVRVDYSPELVSVDTIKNVIEDQGYRIK